MVNNATNERHTLLETTLENLKKINDYIKKKYNGIPFYIASMLRIYFI